MNKTIQKILLFLFVSILIISPALAENKVNLYFFYGQGCPHCASEEIFLEELEQKYPTLEIFRYEVYSNGDNQELFQQCSALAGTEIQGVPTTFIDMKPHIGFSNSIAQQIESEVQRCLVEHCENMLLSNLNDEEICEQPINYNKEEIIGYSFLSVLLLLIIFVIFKKFIFKKLKKKNKK